MTPARRPVIFTPKAEEHWNMRRRRLTQPSIPIDTDRLRMIIAEGDAAEEAHRAAGMRLLAAHAMNEPDMALGRDEVSTLTAQMRDQRIALDRRRSAGHVSEDELAAARAEISATAKLLAEAQGRQSITAATRIAAMERRRRCVAYALERGVRIPEVLRSIGADGRPL